MGRVEKPGGRIRGVREWVRDGRVRARYLHSGCQIVRISVLKITKKGVFRVKFPCPQFWKKGIFLGQKIHENQKKGVLFIPH